jgi:hypothetical protein
MATTAEFQKIVDHIPLGRKNSQLADVPSGIIQKSLFTG